MPRGSFIAMVLAVLLVGGGLGWWLGRPQPLQPTLQAHWKPADPDHPDPSTVPTGSDTAPGWQSRQALRAAVATALDRLESSPCDPAARKVFFEAYANMENALVTDFNQSPDENGPAFWRSDGDSAIGKRVMVLQTANYVTIDEITHVLIRRRMGALGDALPTSGAMQADRCGFTAASLD
jgi:hypothetical protein